MTATLATVGCRKDSGHTGGAGPRPSFVSARGPLVAGCGEPSADPRLVPDEDQPEAERAGALVIYADIQRHIPEDIVQAPEAVVIPQVARAVVMRVLPPARSRFGLLFGGAGTGTTTSGFRVADGLPAVRFPACGDAVGFRGAFVFKGAQCVPIEIQAAGHRPRRFSLAVGRAPATCPNGVLPRRPPRLVRDP